MTIVHSQSISLVTSTYANFPLSSLLETKDRWLPPLPFSISTPLLCCLLCGLKFRFYLRNNDLTDALPALSLLDVADPSGLVF